MNRIKWHELAVFPLMIVFIAGLVLPNYQESTPERQAVYTGPDHLPDFSSYSNVQEKKKAFFEFMLPMIRNANAEIAEERSRIAEMLGKLTAGESLSTREESTLEKLFEKYRLEPPETVTPDKLRDLLMRVDTVPASLVLAQAANESAWGTSRFARRANNFFGIWCFTPGCGLTPRQRDADKTHEVRRYDSIQDSVNHYMHMINTRRAYRELRGIRAELRDENNVNGMALAEGLLRYSERGSDYVRELQQMIRHNKLHQYTRDHSA